MKLILRLAALAILIYLLTGCYTPKKALKDLNKAYDKQEEVVSDFCSDKYPIISDTTHDTTYVKGPIQFLPGRIYTVEADCPPSSTSGGRPVKIKVPCPPCDTHLRVDTKYIRTTIIQEDSARIKNLSIQIQNKDKEINKLQGRKFYTWGFYILLIILLGVAYLMFRYGLPGKNKNQNHQT